MVKEWSVGVGKKSLAFLDAFSKTEGISISQSVRRSVGRSVGRLVGPSRLNVFLYNS